MKSYTLVVRGITLTLHTLLLGVGFLLPHAASGQNLLKNGDFELPLGPTNWTVAYVVGNADDFEVQDRTTIADRHKSQLGNARGAHLRPNNNKNQHAYFTQTVSNLVAGHSYTITGWLKWDGGDATGFGNAYKTYRVYFDALGGQAPARSPDVPEDGADGWHEYTVAQTPDANGKIEVRLHLDKFSGHTYDKLIMINGYFDDFSLTY